MQETKKLDVADLSVETFTTAPAQTVPPEKLTTCLETDCGIRRCCA